MAKELIGSMIPFVVPQIGTLTKGKFADRDFVDLTMTFNNGDKSKIANTTVPAGEVWVIYDIDAFGQNASVVPNHAPTYESGADGDNVEIYVNNKRREKTDYNLDLDKGVIAQAGDVVAVKVNLQTAVTSTYGLKIRLYKLTFKNEAVTLA
jgi:hypothetical protein